MILLDVNVLVAAHRHDADRHVDVTDWLGQQVDSGRPVLLADLAVAGFLRIVTHPRIFDPPTPLGEAIAFIDGLRDRPTCLPVAPGVRHWELLRGVLTDADARANLVPDAYLAALAIEHGATVATRDKGFRRFRDVRSVDPAEAP